MSYAELRDYFVAYHRGCLSRADLEAVICMWQLSGARI